ncbi:MAG: DNA polymerase III subunit alpha [Alphaproteobacteria bacterium RIFCSPHIGHO2_02_FULL_46_13]|nr:MAG: DNA polymerase III subunit alpha [Alphaproteobacteria bacterium RIFCSPHIGHO2_02_FULL_46_13]
MSDVGGNATFIHLHVHSAYSLAEGAIPVKTLVKKCAAMGMPAVAITDSSNLFGAMEFSLEASKAGLQPIIGARILVGDDEHHLVLLVQSKQGYLNLCELLTQSYVTSDGQSKPRLSWDGIRKHAEGLICLSGAVKGPIGQALLAKQNDLAIQRAKDLKDIYGDRFYIELQRHDTLDENQIEDAMIDIAYAENIPLVATNDCYYPSADFYRAHDALLCIAEGRYISEDDRRKVTPEHYLKSPEEMVELFADIPEAIQNTITIAKRCHYFLSVVKPILPPFVTESGLPEPEELKKQSEEGLLWRLEHYVFTGTESPDEKAAITKTYQDRLEFELNTINKMGFPGYFLIVSDFIKWAKANNIPVGPGRGSGAGSIVAWALQITDLNPLQFNLLFERFLNPERVSMPDFDVDFCQDRRDEVIRYVQNRYGHDHVAQIITFGKLQARAVVRDVGRVLQMPYGQIDKIAKMIPANPANPVTLEEALDADPELRNQRSDEQIDRLLTIALQLEGLYRHASTHAAGVVIGDRPLQQLCALYQDPKSDIPATMFNMKYVEQAGLVKYDFLGLKTLTVIQKAVEFIKQVHGIDIEILKIPLDDAKTYEMISSGASTGVFQLESTGMRDTLKKMKPNRFEDIIALVSLYRPGPMDNIPTYIDVKDGRLEPDYLHPKLKPILEETYGIMVYQEQVMQAAQLLAGYTLGGADMLRRAMGKKIKEEMDAQRALFVEGAGKYSDVKPERAIEIFEIIEKFAGYGFNKSHAAAYALVAYQTAWLKANYPVEFMAASMTLDMGNTDKLAVFKQALQEMKIPLLLPDINKSVVEFKVENNAIRYALAAVKGVGVQAMELVLAERAKNGEFKNLEDFLKRMDSRTLNKRQFENLVAAGAFDSIHPIRAQLFEGAESLVHYAAALAEERKSAQNSLFAMEETASTDLVSHHLPQVTEWSPLEKLSNEFSAIGFYLSAHPLDSKQAQLERMRIIRYSEVQGKLSDRPMLRVQLAGVLLRKSEKISQKSGNKFAFLTLSDTSGVYEVLLFSEVLSRSRDFLEVGKSILLSADVEMKEDALRLTVQDVKPLDEMLIDKVHEVALTLDHSNQMDALKKALTTAGEGKSSVTITIHSPAVDKQVKLRLPGFYNFSPELRDELYRLNGLKKLQEN